MAVGEDVAADAPIATKKAMAQIPPETTDPGMEFIDLLTRDPTFGQPLPSDTATPDGAQEKGIEPWSFSYACGNLCDVNFDAEMQDLPPPPPPPPQPPPPQQQQQQQQQPFPSTSKTDTDIDPALFVPSDQSLPPTSLPGLSPNSASAGTCACTASLYLALDSMQRLSSDVATGVRQARHAAKTAYQVVNCPVCGTWADVPSPLEHQHQQHQHQQQQQQQQQHHYQPYQPPAPVQLQNFQNLMLLGTLIPSIAHAYGQLLAAVDREAAAAQHERRRLVFGLRALGGLWGPLGGDEDPCGAAVAFDHREMEPAMWRLTLRALLRLDVYGLYGDGVCGGGGYGGHSVQGRGRSRSRGRVLGRGDSDDGNGNGNGDGDGTGDGRQRSSDASTGGCGTGGVSVDEALYLGLRDIVAMMETRSRARHAVLDAMELSGAWPGPPCSSPLKLHGPGETPTCQQIISIARRSIDQLVIA